MAKRKATRAPQDKSVPLIPELAGNSRVTSLINMAARLTNRAARIRLGRLGAWPGQIPLLLWLIEENGLIQKELARRARMEQPTVAEHLDRLQKDGLITRRRSPSDGRKQQIFVTAKTKALSNKIVRELEHGAAMFTKGIPKNDLATFYRVIFQIIARLDDFIAESEKKPNAT
jgi:DNA-binding MarR family transcriptional regulator